MSAETAPDLKSAGDPILAQDFNELIRRGHELSTVQGIQGILPTVTPGGTVFRDTKARNHVFQEPAITVLAMNDGQTNIYPYHPAGIHSIYRTDPYDAMKERYLRVRPPTSDDVQRWGIAQELLQANGGTGLIWIMGVCPAVIRRLTAQQSSLKADVAADERTLILGNGAADVIWEQTENVTLIEPHLCVIRLGGGGGAAAFQEHPGPEL